MTPQGFKIPEILPEHYQFGAGQLPGEIIQPDSDWRPFAPDPEIQFSNRIDTFNCSGFTTLNLIETVERRKYGEAINYSDRALGIVAGTGRGGNDPHVVMEAARKTGLLAEAVLPFDPAIASVDEYYSPKPLPDALKQTATRWAISHELKHDWVTTSKAASLSLLQQALKSSPLGVAVPGYEKNSKGLYEPMGDVPTHYFTLLYACPEYLEVLDQYPPFRKRLVPDFPLKYAKRIELRLRSKSEQEALLRGKLQVLITALIEALKALLPK
jgi:hypothetical protein